MTTTTIFGKAYVLADNVDTDQILTAEFLKIDPSTAEGRAALGKLAMCGLPDDAPPFLDPQTGMSPYAIVIGGENFGCGSSREHAVVALGSAGVRAVVAQSFARIFFRNCVATGELLPVVSGTRLCERIRTGDMVEIDVEGRRLRAADADLDTPTEPIGELAGIVAAGGLFAYARATGKIARAA